MEQYAVRDGGRVEAGSWGGFCIKMNESHFYLLLTVFFSHEFISKVIEVHDFYSFML